MVKEWSQKRDRNKSKGEEERMKTRRERQIRERKEKRDTVCETIVKKDQQQLTKRNWGQRQRIRPHQL